MTNHCPLYKMGGGGSEGRKSLSLRVVCPKLKVGREELVGRW